MNNEPLLYETLLHTFDKLEEISWPQLIELYSSPERSAIDKNQISEAIKRITKNNWIEKIAGLPQKWRITEPGRYKVKELQRQQESKM